MDGVKDERSAEDLLVETVGSSGYSFLEESPCEARVGVLLANLSYCLKDRDRKYAQGGVDATDTDDELEDGAAVVFRFFGFVGD